MGGVCFLLNGNMVGGADRTKAGQGRFHVSSRQGERRKGGSDLPGADPMVQGGRRMGGFFFVDEKACDARRLKKWVDMAVSHAERSAAQKSADPEEDRRKSRK